MDEKYFENKEDTIELDVRKNSCKGYSKSKNLKKQILSLKGFLRVQ